MEAGYCGNRLSSSEMGDQPRTPLLPALQGSAPEGGSGIGHSLVSQGYRPAQPAALGSREKCLVQRL